LFLEQLPCHRKVFCGIREEFNLVTRLVADFDQGKVIFEANDAHSRLGWDACAASRSCPPQLATHDHGTLRIEFRIDVSNLANQLNVADSGFLVKIKGDDYERSQSCNGG
jgi:hypothetical protein